MEIEQLKRLIEARAGGSQAKFALMLGKSPSQVNQWLAGKRPMGAKIEKDILLKFGPVEKEPSNVAPGPRIRGTVPLLSSVQAGMFKEFLDSRLVDDDIQQIATTVPVNRYTFALRVEGDSMTPEFTAGMLLVVEPELDPLPNDFVIVKNGSEETTFKQLVKDGGEWFLKPLNERYPIKPLGKNTIVGVVRGVSKQFR